MNKPLSLDEILKQKEILHEAVNTALQIMDKYLSLIKIENPLDYDKHKAFSNFPVFVLTKALSEIKTYEKELTTDNKFNDQELQKAFDETKHVFEKYSKLHPKAKA